jgi:16S rRNA (guanine966-N2)-methyltransferase
MRVVAGKYRGLVLKTIEGVSTRPTLDRVKEAVFSSLGDISGMVGLDLFAGSGGIGIEMLSRGAILVWFNDASAQVMTLIKLNLIHCKVPVSDYVLFNNDYHVMLNDAAADNQQFDLIYLDPPFAGISYQSIIDLIQQYKLLKVGGRLIIESELTLTINANELELYKSAKYGRIKVSYLRRNV